MFELRHPIPRDYSCGLLPVIKTYDLMISFMECLCNLFYEQEDDLEVVRGHKLCKDSFEKVIYTSVVR